MSPPRNAPSNMLPLLIGDGAPADEELSTFLQSAVWPIGSHARSDATVDGFSLTLGDTRFFCFRASPARISFARAQKLLFVFPYQGQIRIRTDHAVDDLLSGAEAGLYRSVVSEIVALEKASFICVEIDRQRLLNTALIIQGVDAKSFFVRLEHALNARGVALRDSGVGFPALRHYFSHLNYYASNADLGLSLGLEDLFYRYIVLLVFNRDQFGRRLRGLPNAEKLAVLRDAIHANPSKRFSLAEMSESVGMSPRVLQKHFVSTYGLTPIEWQIGLCLEEARARLWRSRNKVSLAALAAELGFSTPSRFAEQYRRKFGVSPSADMLQMRNRDAPKEGGADEVRNMDSP
jgi:AraC-like DNA-binding protein